MPTIVATPGAANANSYETLAEALAYFDSRLPVAEWEDADSQEALLIMATRVLDAMLVPRRTLHRDACDCQYYLTSRHWTGAPATTTQRLAWPRTGMLDRNGNAIASNVIPQDLKDALSEFAGQLARADSTLDNEVSLMGLTSVKAGSVALAFKEAIEARVLPDAVWHLMPASWVTDEIIEYVMNAPEFNVVS